MCYNKSMLSHLSYSSLDKFAGCGEQFRRLKIEELEGESNTQDNARGKLMHHWLENLVIHRIEHGDWPTQEEARDSLDLVWHEGYEEPNGYNPLTNMDWEEKFLLKSYEDSFVFIPQLYGLINNWVPIAAEREIEIELPFPGKEIKTLQGRIDVTIEPNIIVDWKTKTSPMNAKWLDADLQPTVYTALLGLDKAIINFVQFVYYKRDKPRIVIASTTRDARHTEWLLNTHIPSVIESIESGRFVANPGWHCSFCPVPCGAFPDGVV